MVFNRESGGLMPRKRKSWIPQRLFSPAISVLNRFFSLLVPRDWSHLTLERILNDPERRDEMVKTYIESELAKMNTTGVTGRSLYMAPEYLNLG